MSECVVRMEMPNECPCELWHNCNPYIKYSMTILDASMERFPRPKPLCKGCRIICQLPEGHGRLGDLDELAKMVNAARIEAMQKGFDTNPYWLLGDIIAQAKTIVPAEAERSET